MATPPDVYILNFYELMCDQLILVCVGGGGYENFEQKNFDPLKSLFLA